MIINITISLSSEQVLPGIPEIITLSTNIPSIIFYTLDGSVPNTFSPVYISPIYMPEGPLSITLSVVATNGTDNSAIIMQTFTANNAEIPTAVGARLPHSALTNINNTNNDLFPFGSGSSSPNAQYLNPGDAGTTVYNQAIPAIPSGSDANGNPSGFTNQPIDYYEFQQVYSTLNAENAKTPGVGNLPATTTVIASEYPIYYTQEQSSTADKIFNPRASVIYQDSTTEDPTNPILINRSNFSLENSEIVRDGDLLYNTTVDSPPTMGGFINRHYNPNTNMMNYYYYDNTVGRWIISTSPLQTTNNVGALYNMVPGRDGPNGGGSKYFLWNPYRGRFLM